MHQIEIKYKGNLRTESVHLKSGQKLITDAPVDNKGKGEAFSPTDLTASALGSCMLTIIGIAELIGVKHIGIGSDLCIGHPDSVVDWMRNGKWTKAKDYGEGSASNASFPKQPDWFKDARGFKNLELGLKKVGFKDTEVNDILGNNWYNFYRGIDA